jgi:SAM-dependent methyltransferase
LPQPKHERLSAFDLAESFHLAHAVSTLHDLKVLGSLRQPSTAESIAIAHGLDPGLIRGTLEYITARTNLLRKVGACFVATRMYSREGRFLLDLYAGAYRNNAVQLEKLMRKPTLAATAVDRNRQARAFESSGRFAPSGIPELIRNLQLNYALDIGCGSGALLLKLATQDPDFVGWGLEMNPAMCKVARAGIRAAGVEKRVRVLKGDSKHLRGILPADVRSSVKVVTACQVANEMFGTGSSLAVAWLRGLRKAFPGRLLLLSDYYGRLGSKAAGHHRETLLHDYVQLVSGQGVPPGNIAKWRAIYTEANCRLAHVIEDRGTTRFIHVVVLEAFP